MGCWTIIKMTRQWTWKITDVCGIGRICPSSLTCRMVKMVTKMITNREQIATATTATNATGDLIWSDELAPPLNDPSIRAASPLNKFPSSASCDNCFSAAIRRFPAGEELMQSPAKVEQTKQWVRWMCRESNLKLSFMLIHLFFINSYLFIVHSSFFILLPAPCSHRFILKERHHCHRHKGEERRAWHILSRILGRNKWQCSTENGNEIHVKFITRVAVSFEKWVTKIWWQSDEKRKRFLGSRSLLVELFYWTKEEKLKVKYIDFVF